MHTRNLKIYRSVKYRNKSLMNVSRNPNIRVGDRVCVKRGEHKGFNSVVSRIIGKYAKLEGLFQTSVASKKYFERNGNKNIETRKYIKIAVDNLIHVDKDNNVISVERKSSVVVNNKTFKKCLTDKNGCVIDNFVERAIERRRIKQEKIEQQKNSEKKNIDQEQKENYNVQDSEETITNVEESDKNQDSEKSEKNKTTTDSLDNKDS